MHIDRQTKVTCKATTSNTKWVLHLRFLASDGSKFLQWVCGSCYFPLSSCILSMLQVESNSLLPGEIFLKILDSCSLWWIPEERMVILSWQFRQQKVLNLLHEQSPSIIYDELVQAKGDATASLLWLLFYHLMFSSCLYLCSPIAVCQLCNKLMID